jgi:hypothetical protein
MSQALLIAGAWLSSAFVLAHLVGRTIKKFSAEDGDMPETSAKPDKERANG